MLGLRISGSRHSLAGNRGAETAHSTLVKELKAKVEQKKDQREKAELGKRLTAEDATAKPLQDGAHRLTRVSDAACHIRLALDAPTVPSFLTGRSIGGGARGLGRLLVKFEYTADRLHPFSLIKFIDPSVHSQHEDSLL